jgi:hypothetical protein
VDRFGRGPGDRMAEGRSGREVAPKTARNGSRGFARRIAEFGSALRRSEPLPVGVFVAATVAGVLMVVAELTPIVSVDVLTVPCEDAARQAQAPECEKTGGDQHAYALVLLGLLTLLMGWGASIGASRPAAVALLVAGIAVLVIAATLDLPEIDETGAVGATYSEAEANPGVGFWLELVGGALALIAGGLALRRLRRPG